jgi:hypothetical protein
MSKKLEVLHMLEAAGDRGVRSDEFYKRFNGRGVARIYDLRQDGYEIEGRPDGKYKRYRLLNVGVGTESASQVGRSDALRDLSLHPGVASPNVGVDIEAPGSRLKAVGLNVDSGVADLPVLPVPVEARARTIPSAYSDVWVDNEAA